MHSDAILQSLEMVVERVGDPAPQIYGRLFAENPQLKDLFVLDRDGSVRAEMLRLSFDAIVDLSKEGHYARGLVSTELVNHGNNGVSPAQFQTFFYAIRDAVRDILGAQWSVPISEAWDAVMTSLTALVDTQARNDEASAQNKA